MDHHVFGLFPTPLYVAKLGREFTPQEKKYVEDESQELDPNIGNLIGKHVDVLDHPSMTDLKSFILTHIEKFMEEVYASSNDVEVYLTQSWMNYTYPGQFHHPHMHDNSFLSGVLYINADPEVDSLMFLSGRGHAIRLLTEKFNKFNSDNWTVPVGTGDLLIFPSRITHQVTATPKERDVTRVSLAFNTFLRGEIGHPGHRIHLVLK